MTEITINTLPQYAAILILVLFYTIYVGKMLIQRKKGIRTDQMARGKKNKALFRTEVLLKTATYSTVVVEAVSILLNTTHSSTALKIAGIFLGAAGVVIFGIAVNTMRDNWRAGIPTNEKTTLVSSGIFRISRNPAFLAFDLLYLGLLLLFFNWILLLFSLWSMMMLHLQIKQEEKFLETIFGEEYIKYKRHTGRYIGILK